MHARCSRQQNDRDNGVRTLTRQECTSHVEGEKKLIAFVSHSDLFLWTCMHCNSNKLPILMNLCVPCGAVWHDFILFSKLLFIRFYWSLLSFSLLLLRFVALVLAFPLIKWTLRLPVITHQSLARSIICSIYEQDHKSQILISENQW